MNISIKKLLIPSLALLLICTLLACEENNKQAIDKNLEKLSLMISPRFIQKIEARGVQLSEEQKTEINELILSHVKGYNLEGDISKEKILSLLQKDQQSIMKEIKNGILTQKQVSDANKPKTED